MVHRAPSYPSQARTCTKLRWARGSDCFITTHGCVVCCGSHSHWIIDYCSGFVGKDHIPDRPTATEFANSWSLPLVLSVKATLFSEVLGIEPPPVFPLYNPFSMLILPWNWTNLPAVRRGARHCSPRLECSNSDTQTDTFTLVTDAYVHSALRRVKRKKQTPVKRGRQNSWHEQATHKQKLQSNPPFDKLKRALIFAPEVLHDEIHAIN